MDGKQNFLTVVVVCGVLGLVTCLGDIKDFTGRMGPGCEDPFTSVFLHSYTSAENQVVEPDLDRRYQKTDNKSINVLSKAPDTVRPICSESSYVSKAQWGAIETTKYENMKNKKVSIVFIHHTVLSHCSTGPDCIRAVKKVEELHRGNFRWDDIGYSFLAGEDGRIYQARGWDRVGAHTKGFNKVAISIGAMGNFMLQAPDQKLLDIIQDHLNCGVASGKLEPDYKLYGHRDAINTESPGDFLYDIIKSWPHFDRDTPRPIQPPLL